MSEANTAAQAPITIKKYANRRLYNTATSSYVTLDHLAQMVKEGTDFVVYDAKSGEDITRSVLTQIIGFYGDSLGGLVPRYLEHAMSSFQRNEEQMRHYMQNALDGLFPFNSFEEMSKQNMAFFESAMKMFSPFYNNPAQGGNANPAQQERPAARPSPLDELQARLNAMQEQLDQLSGGKGGKPKA